MFLLVFEESVNDASATAAAAFAFCYTNAEEMMSQQMR